MGRWIDTVHVRRPVNVVVLDMDSGVSPTHGDQEGTAYNAFSAGPAAIPCSCSTHSANLNGASHARATPTASSRWPKWRFRTNCFGASWRWSTPSATARSVAMPTAAKTNTIAPPTAKRARHHAERARIGSVWPSAQPIRRFRHSRYTTRRIRLVDSRRFGYSILDSEWMGRRLENVE